MNIGIVTTWFERGAAYVSRQYKHSLEKEHQVFIYARGGEKEDKSWDTREVTRAKKSKLNVAMAIDRDDYCRWVTENKLEVVFFNEQQWWPPILWTRQLGVIVGAYIDYYTENTVKLFAAYDFLICNTKRHYSVFNWHPQCFYVQWGTDKDIFKPSTVNETNIRQLTFFHSSGMSPERKGTDLVLEAFSRIGGNTKLLIHSQIDLEARLPGHAPLISKLKSQNRLTVLTDTVPAPGLYHLGDVYVYPSRLDGIGLTLLEAAMCGLPLIATDSPPMNEFVNDATGKLVKVEKFISRADGYYWPQSVVGVDSLCNAMRFYVENLKELPLLKKLSRRYAEEKFDWTANSACMPKIFESLKLRQDIMVNEAEQLIAEYEKNRPVPIGSLPNKKSVVRRCIDFVNSKIQPGANR